MHFDVIFDLKTIFIHVQSTTMQNLGTDQHDVSKHGITNNKGLGIIIHDIACINTYTKVRTFPGIPRVTLTQR